jgi:predicted metal-dependent hydrolase
LRTRDIGGEFGNPCLVCRALLSRRLGDHRGKQAGMLALAQSLIDHRERTINVAEIDAVIAQTLACQALDDMRKAIAT